MSEARLGRASYATLEQVRAAMERFETKLGDGKVPSVQFFADGSGSVGYRDYNTEKAPADYEYSFIDLNEILSWLNNPNRQYDNK